MAVTKALGSFRYGHTTYATRCSTIFMFFHVYPLVSIASTPNLLSIYLGNGRTGGPIIGAEVSEINAVDPASYLVALAKSSPQAYFIDLDVQYNTLFIQTIPPSLAIT